MIKLTLGKRLKLLRNEKEKTQQEVAEIIDIGHHALSYYERDQREPDMKVLKKLADYYNVTTDYLLCRVDRRDAFKLDKNELPLHLQDLGIEYLEVTKELKDKGLTPEDIKKITINPY